MWDELNSFQVYRETLDLTRSRLRVLRKLLKMRQSVRIKITVSMQLLLGSFLRLEISNDDRWVFV